MSISIDEDVIKNLTTVDGQKLDINELLICMVILMQGNPTEITQKLLNRGIVILDNNTQQLQVFRKYAELVESILLNSDKAIPTISNVEELATKLQELFPKERKRDVNGIPKYAYRGNKRDVEQRLQKFFKLYGKYSYDDVLKCTKKYVENFQHDKTYMRILPYFIIKDNESQLATELENMDIEDSTQDPALNYGDKLL